MKKGRIIIATLLIVGLLVGAAFAAVNPKNPKIKKYAKWGNRCWTVKMDNGHLTAVGNYGSWKGKSVEVDNGVTKIWTVGTGLGPLVVYQQGELLYMAYLRNNSGGQIFKGKFYKFNFRAIHLKGFSNGASVHVVKPNKDVLVISVDGKGYKYKRLIKYKK
ncbi:MAG: hypothetical protein K8T10_00585 [Candidatus Eremiobacteraeota bacterium]|nr:hypothetical protein [Candidatus Eremiobacteraeota bacterium]